MPPALRLPNALTAWGTPDFAATLRDELVTAGPAALPLQQCVSATSHALDADCTVMLIAVEADAATVRARIGVFFSGIVSGCSCADDPTPLEPQQEYCELELAIDKVTAATLVMPVADPR